MSYGLLRDRSSPWLAHLQVGLPAEVVSDVDAEDLAGPDHAAVALAGTGPLPATLGYHFDVGPAPEQALLGAPDEPTAPGLDQGGGVEGDRALARAGLGALRGREILTAGDEARVRCMARDERLCEP